MVQLYQKTIYTLIWHKLKAYELDDDEAWKML